jgi:hypothetical protein
MGPIGFFEMRSASRIGMFASVVSLPHSVMTITLSAAVHLSPLRGGYAFSPLSRKPSEERERKTRRNQCRALAHYTEDMAEKRRPTINSILKDPAASDWLKAAVRSALECDPADVMRDAQTLVTLMIGYTSRFGYPARRQWPRKKATP